MTDVFLRQRHPTRPKVLLVFPRVSDERTSAHEWLPFPLLTTASAVLDDDLAEVLVFDQNQRDDVRRRVEIEKPGSRLPHRHGIGRRGNSFRWMLWREIHGARDG